MEIDAAPLGTYKSVTQISTQAGITSPFAGPKSSNETTSESSGTSEPPSLGSLGSRQSFMKVPPAPLHPDKRSRSPPKDIGPASPGPASAQTLNPRGGGKGGLSRTARTGSSRPKSITEPGSPGSDQDPDPPRTRQDARPIFGGIAKMIRGQSGSGHFNSLSSR